MEQAEVGETIIIVT